MRRFLRSLLKRARPQPSAPASRILQFGAGTEFLPGWRIDERIERGATRVRVGSDSVLACSIVLERGIGSVEIGDRSFIGRSNLVCADEIRIGSDVLVAWGCWFVDHDSHSMVWQDRAEDVERWRLGMRAGGLKAAAESKDWAPVRTAPIRVDDRAWIGFNSTLLKGVTIGEGAVVAAGSLVTKNVEPYTVVGGNPAQVIRVLEPHP